MQLVQDGVTSILRLVNDRILARLWIVFWNLTMHNVSAKVTIKVIRQKKHDHAVLLT